MGVCCTDKAMVTMVRIIACKVCQQSTHANDGMRIVCSIQHVCRLFDVENHIIFCMYIVHQTKASCLLCKRTFHMHENRFLDELFSPCGFNASYSYIALVHSVSQSTYA